MFDCTTADYTKILKIGKQHWATKELNMFNKEGSAGIDVKVPSTDNPEKVIWVIACTEEVQCCRQIAAINTVMVMENQNNET